MLAQVVAAGVGAGFSGDWKTIEALARNLGTPVPGRGRAPGTGLGDAVSRLEARIGGRNADRRRARR